MKKTLVSITIMLTAMMLIFTLTGCGSNINKDEITIDYGHSSIYTEKDMDKAVKLIFKEFKGWLGCEMHSLRYAGDEYNNEENLQKLNEAKEGGNYTQCMIFLCDYHAPRDGGGAWEPDKEYIDYEWWLGRSGDGDWQLLTWKESDDEQVVIDW